jgi:hypothetical protein
MLVLGGVTCKPQLDVQVEEQQWISRGGIQLLLPGTSGVVVFGYLHMAVMTLGGIHVEVYQATSVMLRSSQLGRKDVNISKYKEMHRVAMRADTGKMHPTSIMHVQDRQFKRRQDYKAASTSSCQHLAQDHSNQQ